jgi:hypothetical protein
MTTQRAFFHEIILMQAQKWFPSGVLSLTVPKRANDIPFKWLQG